jgi:hypothetical protein
MRTEFVLWAGLKWQAAVVVAFLTLRTAGLGQAVSTNAGGIATNFLGMVTNGPAVFRGYSFIMSGKWTNSDGIVVRRPVSKLVTGMTNLSFDHFLPDSLYNLVWTNLIAHTNHRDTLVWAARSHPPGWPAKAPIAAWNTNGLMWGMRGLTALSPCWETEGSSGQAPVTALTRRHGYMRGHSVGPDGFRTNFTGRKIWFVTTNDEVIEVTAAREVVRTSGRDYSIILFSHDLPASIEPLRVAPSTNLMGKYWVQTFKTEQSGHVSADIPGFTVDTWKGGDSGSPNMLPLPGELVFLSGRSTSGPSPEMQADMDELCRLGGIDPKRYQMQWVDLEGYRTAHPIR